MSADLSAYDPTTWPVGADLVILEKTVFPVVSEAAADAHTPFTQAHFTGGSLMLHSPERVRLVRHLDCGKHILCRHANATLFASSTKRFSPLKQP